MLATYLGAVSTSTRGGGHSDGHLSSVLGGHYENSSHQNIEKFVSSDRT